MKLFDFNNVENTEKLLRYRRAMLCVVGLCVFTSISMMSGLALGLGLGFHTVELIIVGIFCAICLTTIVPFLFFFAWITEIEKILTQRQIGFDRPIKEKIREWTLKMMFWAILVALLPFLIRKLIA